MLQGQIAQSVIPQNCTLKRVDGNGANSHGCRVKSPSEARPVPIFRIVFWDNSYCLAVIGRCSNLANRPEAFIRPDAPHDDAVGQNSILPCVSFSRAGGVHP